MRVSRWATRWALKRSLKRRSPARFTYSKSVNYYSPQLIHSADGTEVLVDELKPDAVLGRVWNGAKFEQETSIPSSELGDWNLKVHRFYGFDHLVYEGWVTFFAYEYSLSVHRRRFWDAISQKVYNYRTRFLEDQISVLKGIIDLHLKSAPEGTGLLHVPEPHNIIDLFSKLYGQRIYGHPRYNEESAKFRLIVEALAENGDLVKTEDSSFRLNPSALNTINKFENDERRHDDNNTFNLVMIILTTVLAYSALMSSCTGNDDTAHSPNIVNPDQ